MHCWEVGKRYNGKEMHCWEVGGGGGGGGGRGLSFSLKTFLVFQLEIIYEFRIFFLAPFYINTEGLF